MQARRTQPSSRWKVSLLAQHFPTIDFKKFFLWCFLALSIVSEYGVLVVALNTWDFGDASDL